MSASFMSPSIPGHPELSVVLLDRSVASDHGTLPPGAVGTVVHVYPDKQTYEVEFFSPFHTVATVQASAIRQDVSAIRE